MLISESAWLSDKSGRRYLQIPITVSNSSPHPQPLYKCSRKAPWRIVKRDQAPFRQPTQGTISILVLHGVKMLLTTTANHDRQLTLAYMLRMMSCRTFCINTVLVKLISMIFYAWQLKVGLAYINVVLVKSDSS